MTRESEASLLIKYLATQSKSEWRYLYDKVHPDASEEKETVYNQLIAEDLLPLD